MVQIHPDPPIAAAPGAAPSRPLYMECIDIPRRLAQDRSHGAIAQLGERLPCTQEVGGSIPPGSTISRPAATRSTLEKPDPGIPPESPDQAFLRMARAIEKRLLFNNVV